MNKLLDHIFYFVLSSYIFIIMLDPTNDLFGLKNLLFVFVLLLTFVKRNFVFDKISLVFILFNIVLFFYSILCAFLNNTYYDESFQISILKLTLFSFIIYAITSIDRDKLLEMNYKIGLFLSIIIICVFIYCVSSTENFVMIYDYMMEFQRNPTILISKRSYYGFEFLSFFYRSAPFVLFALVYKGRRIFSFVDFVSFVLIFFSLLISGSRVPMLSCLLILLYAFMFVRKMNFKLKIFLVIMVVLLFVSLVVLLLLERDSGSLVKYSLFDSYVDNLFESFSSFMGEGVGSVFYDVSRKIMITHSELSFFDSLRFFGFFLGGLFNIVVFLPSTLFFISDSKDVKDFGLAYFLYMVIASTNPFLFCSTGWYVFALGFMFLCYNSFMIKS